MMELTNMLVMVLSAAILGLTDAQYYGEKVGDFPSNTQHDVAGEVYIVDMNRIRIRNFDYDGKGPDAFFWVGTSDSPDGNGIIVPNEAGSSGVLSGYMKADIVITLPAGQTVSSIKYLSVWCRKFNANFGHVAFPGASKCVPEAKDLGNMNGRTHGVSSGNVRVVDDRTVVIADFKYDGLGPDAFFIGGSGDIKASNGVKFSEKLTRAYTGETVTLNLPAGSSVRNIAWISAYCIQAASNFGEIMIPANLCVPPFVSVEQTIENCAQMNDDFNVGWAIDGSDIMFEFSGALGSSGYMAFGLSGSDSASSMNGGDVIIAYTSNGIIKAEDFKITAYSLCANGQGVCRDADQGGTNNVELVSGTVMNGVTKVKVKRPLVTGDDKDKDIMSNGDMYVIWALGDVNDQEQVTKHHTRLQGNMKLNFGRSASSECKPISGGDGPMVDPWPAEKINCGDKLAFNATIGPTGGAKGYQGITGQVSWGIAWYLNGMLIPELTLVRGTTYTFYVQGGKDESNQAQYHPMYITNDQVGGYSAKSEEDQKKVTIYAGAGPNGDNPTVGKYCEYKGTADPLDYDTFGAYKATLTLECEDQGTAGMFTFTPDANTPDVVYYQCFTHNYLGWKINVVDDCSGSGSATIKSNMFVIVVMATVMAVLTMFE